MKDTTRLIVESIVVLAMAWMIQGCSTIEGIGKDMQAGAVAGRHYLANE